MGRRRAAYTLAHLRDALTPVHLCGLLRKSADKGSFLSLYRLTRASRYASVDDTQAWVTASFDHHVVKLGSIEHMNHVANMRSQADEC